MLIADNVILGWKPDDQFDNPLPKVDNLAIWEATWATPSHTQQIFELLVLQVSIGVEMI